MPAPIRSTGSAPLELSPQVCRLRCLECRAPLRVAGIWQSVVDPELGPDGELECEGCSERYPIIGGTPRMLPPQFRAQLHAEYPLAIGLEGGNGAGPSPGAREIALKQRTAKSFAYEWHRFGKPRPEWRRNFLEYMRPHDEDFFRGRSVLDVGAGSGRHSREASELGAEVVAVDLGTSIDVARRNLPPDVLTVQADAEQLPFEDGSFDFVMSIGVLHHLPDPVRALGQIVPLVRPGGHLHIYLYWMPDRPVHRLLLRLVSAARLLTVRMPRRVLHALCYPVAGCLFVAVVLPHRLLRRRPRLKRASDALPLKAYANYPFGVLVNDQFDRFSAPLERRYSKTEVEEILDETGLVDSVVLPNNGWVGDARRSTGASDAVGRRRALASTSASARARVLHVLSCDDWAGTEVQVSTQVMRNPDPDLCEQAVAILEPPGVVYRRLADRGTEVHSLAGSFGMAGAALRLIRLIRTRRFNVIEAYGARASMLARVGVLAGRRPALVLGIRGLHFRGSESPDGLTARLVIAVERMLGFTVTCYDANSDGAKEFLVSRGLPREKFSVIPSGAETSAIPMSSHRNGGPPRLICVARFVPGKGHDVLLRALARVRDAGGEFRSELIGYGPSLKAMNALALELGLGEEVLFAGRQPLSEVRTRLAQSDCFVLASVGEGMPGSVLEAMAARLPVVATDVSGSREVVLNGETGLLVPPGDIDRLSEALLTLLGDPALRKAMGSAGRARAEREFGFDSVGRAKVALYKELAAARG